MKYIFDSPQVPRTAVTITGPELSIAHVTTTVVTGSRYSFDADVAPSALVVVTGASPLVAAQVAFAVMPPPSTLPIPRMPADCPFTITYPSVPDGPTIKLTANVAQYVVPQSNVVIDLMGFKVNTLTIPNGVSRVRITNGSIGTVSTSLMNNASLPLGVTDVIIDHINFVGGNTTSDGNGLRIGRLMIANCTSVAATTPTSLDGVHTCVLWLDPGSTDLLVQDCDFWTRGHEACFRIVSSKRTVVHSSKLGCRSEKHCYRIHGNNGVHQSQDSWISDCELRNRGLMIATLPDATGPQADVVQRTYVKRLHITMNQDGMGGADASFGFPAATLTAAGDIRLQTAVVEDLVIVGSWDAVAFATSVGAANPQLGWSFARNTFIHV